MFLQTNSSFSIQIDFWSYPSPSLNPVDIHVDPASATQLEDLLDGAGISFKVDSNDVASLIDAEKASPRAGGFDSKYHRLGEVTYAIFLFNARSACL